MTALEKITIIDNSRRASPFRVEVVSDRKGVVAYRMTTDGTLSESSYRNVIPDNGIVRHITLIMGVAVSIIIAGRDGSVTRARV